MTTEQITHIATKSFEYDAFVKEISTGRFAVRGIYNGSEFDPFIGTAFYGTEGEAQAAIDKFAAGQVTPPARGAYTEVGHSEFGTGRVYNSQRGATQYDDGTGTYGVQVWDNS